MKSPIKSPDPMGDVCCRERLTRPGKEWLGSPTVLAYKCEICGLLWLKIGDDKPFTLTKSAMEEGGFGHWIKKGAGVE